MLSKGQRINDRYEIIGTIGEGGMANVYLAKDVLLERQVAVKVLRGDLAGNEKFIRRFQREAKSVSDLSHPNIVEVYDVGEEDGQHYIVMEYIDGKTLKQLIQKRGSLTVPEVIDIMTQLTDGLAVAHDAYIIHRDLKPQNIMILDNGMIKITDFGIATSMNATSLTQTNSVMGSVHYLPPEQAEGLSATTKSDIYSLGILMYELLTGSVPFKGDNAVEIALKQMKEKLPSIRKQNPLIPQSIENIILKATAKNPKNRYDNVREMNEDLKHALDPENAEIDKYIYPYPESTGEELPIKNDLEQLDSKSSRVAPPSKGELEESEEFIDKKDKKKIIIISSVVGGLLLIMILALVLLNMKNKGVDIKVPDVVGMQTEKAEKSLEKKGFKVTVEQEESEEVEEGHVIKTSPKAGSYRKKGANITIVESSGSYLLEDYTGENYNKIEEKLKNLGIEVKIEKKSVENSSDYLDNEDIIIDQEPKFEKGKEKKLVKGDKVTLYIPDVVNTYPDMVDEEWTLSDAIAFADQYKINLKIKDKNGKSVTETKEYEESKITAQSRPAGDTIISGISLTVTIEADTRLYKVTAKFYENDNLIAGEAEEIVAENLKNGSTGKYKCKDITGYTTITNGETDYKIDGKDIVIKCSYKKKTSSTE